MGRIWEESQVVAKGGQESRKKRARLGRFYKRLNKFLEFWSIPYS